MKKKTHFSFTHVLLFTSDTGKVTVVAHFKAPTADCAAKVARAYIRSAAAAAKPKLVRKEQFRLRKCAVNSRKSHS